jgi:16S rRNA (uracil1498-N3)-methyltransferase
MHIFYQPSLDLEILPATFALDSEESYHCIKVLRLRIGSLVHLTDGKGNLFEGLIESEDPKRCLVSIQSFTYFQKKPFYLHLAVAPTKNIDRFEWFLEKATEIGIDEITPLICEHSERSVIRTDRLKKILVSAMKQSMNLHMPKLNESIKFKDFLRQEFSGQKFIGYVEEKQEIHITEMYTPGSDALILIGPEGDFSKAEVSMATKSGFSAISLGPSRLRTETAGIVATMIVNLKNQ